LPRLLRDSDGSKRGAPAPLARVSIDRWLLLLLWTILLVLFGGLSADPDLWGNIRFGADIARDLRLPSKDPYSFTSDLPWVNHEWLSEVPIALAFGVLGSPGLLALKLLLAGLAAWILARSLRAVPAVVQFAVVLTVAWASSPVVMTIRPQLFSYALTAILAAWLVEERPQRRLLLIPPMFILWVNAHGGWIVGGWLLAAWGGVRIWDSRWRGWVIAIGTATLLATLANPYGWRIWTFLYQTVGLERDIREWRPLSMAPINDWWPWLLTLAGGVCLELIQPRKSLLRMLTLGFLAYASFRVVRLIPFFALTSAIYLAPALKAAFERRKAALTLVAPSKRAAALALIPSLVLASVSIPEIVKTLPCIPITGDWAPDRRTAMALQKAGPQGRMVTAFGWGHYSIFHFGPELRVSLDGRRETIYSPQWMEDLWEMEAGYARSRPLYARLRPEYVWLPKEDTAIVRSWLVANGYRIDVESDRAWIAVRSDLPVIAPSEVDAAACFPG